MTILTPSQLAQYYSNAGFTGNNLVTMTAISLAESGGNTAAVGNGAVGISQIQVGAHNAAFNAQYPASVLTDPQTNANAAYSLFQQAGGSFNDWTTFTGGEYQRFLSQAQQGASNIGQSGTGTGGNGSGSTTGNWLSSLLQGGGASIGIGSATFVAALVLLALGLYALFHKQINSAVKTGAEVAAIVPK